MKLENKNITIIGAGNLGLAVANGMLASGLLDKNSLTLTRRKTEGIADYQDQGITVTSDNKAAAASADIIILAIQPQQLNGVAEEITGVVKDKVVVSTLTGVKLNELAAIWDNSNAIIRTMPNTAMAVRQSMTCISTNSTNGAVELVEEIFGVLGETIRINDELMQAATVLGASGIAFWMRLIRATTQGGIQMGFDAPEAKKIAVQTCLGAASILSANEAAHPESEIDKVTTPKGCTIAGLNEMEHMGLSSALIRGLIESYNKINEL